MAFRAEPTDAEMAVADLWRLIRNVGLVKPIEEDYAYRALTYPQIAAIYCWERGQGPHFVTLVDAPDQAVLYTLCEFQAELGAVHLGEPSVFDQTPPRQHLAAARLAITDLLGDGAACIFQRPQRASAQHRPFVDYSSPPCLPAIDNIAFEDAERLEERRGPTG